MKMALKDNERIRQVYRQKPVVLTRAIGPAVIVVVLLLFLILRYSITGLLRNIIFAVIVIILLYCIRKVLIWRLNRYVVTNQRLLNFSHNGLFDQTVTETPHERILNVSYKHSGIASTIGGYGDVVVQVVGLMEPIILKNISQPMEIKDYLWEMHKRIAKDMGNVVYGDTDATHVEENVGYTKPNQPN